ncbi:hypothetical protein COHA_003331 [Chlorella ohadii]|uniref:Peptidase S1 domain-containing protein n=1 Tax=Chlorella ohadii TaxID=2649997 RepID=A0AAD5DSQ2_9CHLO|nr:hypothetical protein COHA_003331 [Chlorella ohadii]
MRTQDKPADYEQFLTQQTAVHPKFKSGFTDPVTTDLMNNDVALLLLPQASTMPVMKLVGPTNKPTLPVKAGTVLTSIGWGVNGYTPNPNPPPADNPTLPQPLQMIRQKMLRLDQCQARKGSGDWADRQNPPVSHNVQYNFATNAMICASRDTWPVGGTCQGDSGGPLFVAGASAAEDYQVGTVSWGSVPCNVNPTDVYANLGQLFNWIDATVFVWTGDHLTPWAPVEPCKQDPAKGCATCRPAPNQNKCATCTNPAYIVNAAGKASGVQSWHAQPCVPAPFRPVTGKMLADNRAVGFYGQRITYKGAIGEPVDIVSAAPFWVLNGRLVRGSRWSTRALGTVHWAYNNVVDVGISNGRMVVTVNGRLQRPGPVLAVAAAGTSGQEKCNYHPDRCYNGWCDSRRVDILHPAITIAITQPYMRSGRSGRFANWLEVEVVIKAQPKQQLTGYLGETILFTGK